MCCTNIEKKFLIFTNGLFLSISIFIAFCAARELSSSESLEEMQLGDLSDFRNDFALLSMVVGILSSALHFLGLYGAYKWNSLLLTLYARFLIAVVILNTFYTVLSAQSLDVMSVTKFEPLFKNNSQDGMNYIQNKFECCGYNEPDDVQSAAGYPWSCCGTENDSCMVPLYKEGCSSKVKRIITSILMISLSVRVVSILMHVLCIIAAYRMFGKRLAKVAVASKYAQIPAITQ